MDTEHISHCQHLAGRFQDNRLLPILTWLSRPFALVWHVAKNLPKAMRADEDIEDEVI